jgi:hypothetical protein
MITLDEAQAELGRLRRLADQIRTAEYRTVSLYHRVYDRTNGGGWKLWRERREAQELIRRELAEWPISLDRVPVAERQRLKLQRGAAMLRIRDKETRVRSDIKECTL